MASATRIAEVLWATITDDMQWAQKHGAQGIAMKQFVATKIIPRLARALEDYARSQQPRDTDEMAIADELLERLRLCAQERVTRQTYTRTPQSVVLDAFASVTRSAESRYAKTLDSLVRTMFFAAGRACDIRNAIKNNESSVELLATVLSLENALLRTLKKELVTNVRTEHERITNAEDQQGEAAPGQSRAASSES